MKNLVLLITIIFCVQLSATAQNKAAESKTQELAQEIKNNYNLHKLSMQTYPHIQKELTEKFGEKMNLATVEVVAYLQNMVQNEDRNEDDRRIALMILYGDKAAEHAEEISDKNKNADSKK